MLQTSLQRPGDPAPNASLSWVAFPSADAPGSYHVLGMPRALQEVLSWIATTRNLSKGSYHLSR